MSHPTAPTASAAQTKRPARAQALKDLKLLVTLMVEAPRLASQMVREKPWVAQEHLPRIEGQTEFSGAQPMALASALRRVDVMAALLNAGASPHAVTPDKGQTALAHALSTSGDEEKSGVMAEAAMLLVNGGARLSAIDKLGADILYNK